MGRLEGEKAKLRHYWRGAERPGVRRDYASFRLFK